MKKLILVTITSLILFSNSYAQDNLSIKDYGNLHNQCVSEYLKQYGSSLQSTDFKTLLNNELKIMQKVQPTLFKDVKVDELYQYYSLYSKLKDFNKETFWNNYKSNITESGELSNNIMALMDDLLKNNYSFETIKFKVETVKNQKGVSDEDIQRLNIFLAVLEDSNVLWANYARVRGELSCNDYVIIMDAAGALMFLAAGPIAVLNSAACSLAASHSGPCNK